MSYQKERRKRLKEAGLCVQCGETSPRKNKTTCEECGIKNSKAMQKWQNKKKKERQSKGFCSCGRSTLENKKTCEQCSKKNRNWYYRRKELGLCTYCGNKSKDNSTRCESCAQKLSDQKKEIRKEVLDAYGGPICNCCGETTEMFLCIDHINNDGSEHRKEIRKNTINKWLKDNNFPKGYQILCFNCNMGKQLNGGICPHQDPKFLN